MPRKNTIYTIMEGGHTPVDRAAVKELNGRGDPTRKGGPHKNYRHKSSFQFEPAKKTGYLRCMTCSNIIGSDQKEEHIKWHQQHRKCPIEGCKRYFNIRKTSSKSVKERRGLERHFLEKHKFSLSPHRIAQFFNGEKMENLEQDIEDTAGRFVKK